MHELMCSKEDPFQRQQQQQHPPKKRSMFADICLILIITVCLAAFGTFADSEAPSPPPSPPSPPSPPNCCAESEVWHYRSTSTRSKPHCGQQHVMGGVMKRTTRLPPQAEWGHWELTGQQLLCSYGSRSRSFISRVSRSHDRHQNWKH